MRRALFLALICAFLAAPVVAQDRGELSQNNPVAIASLVQGEAEIKHVDGEWRAIYWLDLLRPEDEIRTAGDGKVVLTFFHDDHMEIIDPGTDARMAFRNVTQTSPGGQVRVDRPRDRAVTEIPIPYMLMRELYQEEFQQAQEPGAYDKEKVFLGSWIKANAFPPVFNWSNTGAAGYKFQLFNEWDEFLYEKDTAENRFKYPYQGPFQLAKNSLYKWQVTDNQDNIVVRKYPFVLLTTLHAREVERAEKRFDNLVAEGKVMKTHYTDMFLLYLQRKMIDKYLHLLQQMSDIDPENPVIWRGLVRAYLSKGCPAHALEARERELQLGGVDPIKD